MQLKFQIVFVVLAALGGFALQYSSLAALYGGLVSVLNVLWLARHSRQQTKKLAAGAQASVNMLFASFFMRLGLVMGLVLLGFVVVKLDPFSLVVGLAVGQVGFLVDSIILNKLSKGT